MTYLLLSLFLSERTLLNLLYLRFTEVRTKFLKDLRKFLFSKSVTNPTLYLWTDWRLSTLQYPWLLLFLLFENVLVYSLPPSLSLLLLSTQKRRFVSRFLFLLRSSAGILTGRSEVFRFFCHPPASPSGGSNCGCSENYDNLHSLLFSESSSEPSVESIWTEQTKINHFLFLSKK